jgi:hypothetical protein
MKAIIAAIIPTATNILLGPRRLQNRPEVTCRNVRWQMNFVGLAAVKRVAIGIQERGGVSGRRGWSIRHHSPPARYEINDLHADLAGMLDLR